MLEVFITSAIIVKCQMGHSIIKKINYCNTGKYCCPLFNVTPVIFIRQPGWLNDKVRRLYVNLSDLVMVSLCLIRVKLKSISTNILPKRKLYNDWLGRAIEVGC